MRLILLGALAAAIARSSLPVALNLTGIWTLDPAKSTAGFAKALKSLTLDIDQRQGEIEVVWVMENDQGKSVWVEDLVSGGEKRRAMVEGTIVLAAAGSRRAGQKFHPLPDGYDTVASTFVVWTVSPDGSALLLQQNSIRLNGTAPELLVFKRASETVE